MRFADEYSLISFNLCVWPRKRIDISWPDLAFGLLACACPASRETERRTEQMWSGRGDTLVSLSVRSALDLYLVAAGLPRGGEVLVTAVTIADMARVIEQNGLTPVPVDLDPQTMAPTAETLHRALSPKSCAILVAPLFGGRINMAPILEFARLHRLLVLEDAAQLFAGPDYGGDPDADASFFSFGPIKTATALGGAISRVRDPEILRRMRETQEGYPLQSRADYLRRVVKHIFLKALAVRPVYGAILRLTESAGLDFGAFVNRSVRGFPGPALIEHLRRRPCAPLLAMLLRRLTHVDSTVIAARAAKGEALRRMLGDGVLCPGSAAPHHTYWVFPVCVDDPDHVRRALLQHGFDSTAGGSLVAIAAPPSRPETDPARARATLAQILYVPCFPDMPDSALHDLAAALRAAQIGVEVI